MAENNKFESIPFTFDVTPLPEFKTEQGKSWVRWGRDNLYCDYLVDLYSRSPRHGTIINAKVDYILGGGLTFDDTNIMPSEEAMAIDFIKFMKSNNQSYEMIRDGELFNGVAVEIIWNKKRTKPVQLVYIPFSRLRTNEDESEYYYSKNWRSNIQDEKTTGFRVFQKFDINKPADSQIYVYTIKGAVKTGQPNVYPTPNYQSGVIDIESDIAIGEFDNSNLLTGFTAGTIINFNNGEPSTKTAKEAIVNAVKHQGTGANKAGAVFVSFNNSKDKETTVTSITPSDLDKQNIEVDKRVESRIYATHKITNPALFGIRNEGAISGDNNLGKDFELFQSIYTDNRQKWHEHFINDIAKYFGVTTPVTFKRVPPITQSIDSSKISEAYTIDEVRDILGLPSLKTKKSDASEQVINSINSLSPLVANKVLESMTTLEIRALVGLKEALVITPTPVQMSAEESIEMVFSKYGRKKQEFDIIESREFTYTNDEELITSEFNFASELDSISKSVLDLINKDETIEIPRLAEALKSDNKTIQNIINDLTDNGYLTSNDRGLFTTEIGNDVLNNEKIKTKSFEVLYGYDWRAGFSNKDKKTSREFCVNLLNLDLLYTKDEIRAMQNEIGTDVWTFKGGWYTKPDTNIHLPYCRHTWHQYLVKKK